MPDEPFMLVSLKGDKAKKLAQVMSNPTCTRILDYLAQAKESTESDIAKQLKIPLSTVHYNIQQLVSAKLVIVDEFHYSPKGREVNHYKLANKYIIIAPKDDDPHFLDRLKRFIPVTVLTIGAAVILKTMQFMTPGGVGPSSEAAPMLRNLDVIAPSPAAYAVPEAANEMTQIAADSAADTAAMKTMDVTAAAGSAPTDEGVRMMMATNDAVNVSNITPPNPLPPVEQLAPFDPSPVANDPYWWQSAAVEWFLVGAVFVLVIIILNELFSYWREQRSRKR